MKRIAKAFFHTLLFLLLLLALDQFLLRVPLELPGLSQARTFYVDFRSRLFKLAEPGGSRPQGVEELIESALPEPAPLPRTEPPAPPASAPQPPAAPAAEPRYLYQGQDGELRFADSLDEIPPADRKNAQRLGR